MTPAEIFSDSCALLNDQIGAVFTDEVLLPYFNMATQKLQETFELYDIPVTHETSAILVVPAGITRIAFQGTIPNLPGDLIEMQGLYESLTGLNNWTPVTKVDYISANNSPAVNQFGSYAWISQEIRLIPSNAINDLKIEYVRSILPRITIGQIETPIPILNTSGFLTNWTAGLAAFFIGENSSRAEVLYGLANESLERSLGISIKGQQSIATRRRPFRAAYKSRD